jgi:hypothetical protein
LTTERGGFRPGQSPKSPNSPKAGKADGKTIANPMSASPMRGETIDGPLQGATD